jgi:hypothetical protein
MLQGRTCNKIVQLRLQLRQGILQHNRITVAVGEAKPYAAQYWRKRRAC